MFLSCFLKPLLLKLCLTEEAISTMVGFELLRRLLVTAAFSSRSYKWAQENTTNNETIIRYSNSVFRLFSGTRKIERKCAPIHEPTKINISIVDIYLHALLYWPFYNMFDSLSVERPDPLQQLFFRLALSIRNINPYKYNIDCSTYYA